MPVTPLTGQQFWSLDAGLNADTATSFDRNPEDAEGRAKMNRRGQPSDARPGEMGKNATPYLTPYCAPNLVQVSWRQSPIAGTFRGNLDNAGETIRLADGVDETVLEFTYDDNWFPGTDGFGYSLVVADESVPWTAWNDRSGWASSRALLGSPGRDEAEQAAWRARYFSFAEQADPAVSGDAADPDGDGLSNFQEYLSGTHPRDRQSYLKITALSHAGDHPRIRFPATAGNTYTIQYRDSLAVGQWMPLADVSAQTTTRLIEVADPSVSGKAARYYRLVTPQTP